MKNSGKKNIKAILHPTKGRITNFWNEDRNLSVFLFLLIFVMFFLGPMAQVHPFAKAAFSAFFGLILISGVASVFQSSAARAAAFIVVIGSLVLCHFNSALNYLVVQSLNVCFIVSHETQKWPTTYKTV